MKTHVVAVAMCVVTFMTVCSWAEDQHHATTNADLSSTSRDSNRWAMFLSDEEFVPVAIRDKVGHALRLISLAFKQDPDGVGDDDMIPLAADTVGFRQIPLKRVFEKFGPEDAIWEGKDGILVHVWGDLGVVTKKGSDTVTTFGFRKRFLKALPENTDYFKKAENLSRANQSAQTSPKTALINRERLLPPFSEELRGSNPVRVCNPNDFAVATGIRVGTRGKNFDVPPNGVQTVYVPNGKYDIYFVYSDKPDALFQGDAFTLNNNGVEIQIVKVVDGNYGIRQVK